MYRLYFTKVPAILPTGSGTHKIVPANTAPEKRKKRKSKRKVLRGATHFYKQETVSLLSLAARVVAQIAGRREKKKEKFKRNNIQLYRKHGTWRNIETCAKLKFANTISSPSHVLGASGAQHPPAFPSRFASNGRSRDCKLCRPIRKRVICRNYTWTFLVLGRFVRDQVGTKGGNGRKTAS